MTRRLLFVVHYPVFGGPHNQALRLAESLRHNLWDTVVLLPDEPGSAAQILERSALDVARIPLRRVRSISSFQSNAELLTHFARDVNAIRQVIRTRNIELVVLAGLVNPHAAVAARIEGIPVVWQILDTLSPGLIRRILMPFVARVSDVVMTTGLEVARQHPGAMELGDRLVPFFPPVDVDAFRPDGDARIRARSELGIGARDFVVGNVSNLSPMKGHLTFIRAAAALRRTEPSVRFVILGAGYDDRVRYTNSLLKEAESLGLEIGSSLVFREPGERVAELAAAFDVFWLTSRPRSEGIPTVVGEAMALGLPVVASDVGSVREAVLHGVTGAVVPPLEPDAFVHATLPYLLDADLRCQTGAAGRARAEELFAVDVCTAAHMHAFDLAVARRAVRHAAKLRGEVFSATVEDLYCLLSCPVCRGDLEWDVAAVTCSDCGRMYRRVDSIPILLAEGGENKHKRQQVDFFDKADREFEITRPHGTSALYQSQIGEKFRRSVESLVTTLPGATTLTVCGGSGMDAEFLARAGARVIASDISLEAARRSAERGRRNGLPIVPIVADVEALPFRDRTVDLVYVHDGLHHLEVPRNGLREMLRVSGKAVSINEPARAQVTMLAAKIGLAEHREEAGNFIARLEPSTVAEELGALGFLVVRNERYAMVYRHVPGVMSGALSRPPLIQLTKAALHGFNVVAGAVGNKLTIQGVRDTRDERSKSNLSTKR